VSRPHDALSDAIRPAFGVNAEANTDRHPTAFGLADQRLHERHEAVAKMYLGVAINSKNELTRSHAREVRMCEQSANDQVPSRHPLIVDAGPNCNHGVSDASRRSLDGGDSTDDPVGELSRKLSVTLPRNDGLIAFVEGQV
jgi:hypothetical protein